MRIRVSPAIEIAPAQAPLPLEGSRRWYSPHEIAGARPCVPIFLSQVAYEQATRHAASQLDNEVGGVLIGKWCAEAATGPGFVTVTTTLPARFTQHGRAFLTFTQASLVDIHLQLDELPQDLEIVGWYHTHPRMGVFLSHYDTWLHQHFFPEPWHVALVIEPLTCNGGFFIRQVDGLLDPRRYFGFYELDGKSGTSLVQWSNLQSDQEEPVNKGADIHE